MTPQDVKLVQESFAKVAPISATAAELFYGRLFEIAPQVRAMFPDDMTEQRKKLMATLAIVVNGLNNLDAILPAASALAKRHVVLRRAARALPGGRGSAAVDARKRFGRVLDAAGRGCLDLRLHDAVRLHDQRGLRPEGRVMLSLSPQAGRGK